MEKKVSIITPCYNGEEFLGRYLDSVLNQSYNNLEVILIDDGSTDKTSDIAKSYERKFLDNNIEFLYIYQSNRGQAEALNKGLKIFKGEYLTWPDSDDILSTDSIEKKVKFLEENNEYDIVRSDAQIVNENNTSKILNYFAKDNSNKFKEDLFLDYIIEDKVWFAPGCFMVRTKAFLEVNPNKKIYSKQKGQNWQMLLPVFYKFKCGFINEPLYTYVVRSESHSHKIINYSDYLIRTYEHEDILNHTIASIPMDKLEKELYLDKVKEKYTRKRFYLAIKLMDRTLLDDEFTKMKNIFTTSLNDRLLYILTKTKLINILIKLKRRILDRKR
ncbi:glycosyltransferase [Metabacillus sp. SLBN-84]